MMPIDTDPIEVAAVLASSVGVLVAAYALMRALRLWRFSLSSPALADTRPIAMRRFQSAGWYLLMLTILFMTSVVSVWMPLGPLQAMLRNTVLTILTMMLTYKAAVEHWQHRAVDPRSSEAAAQ